MSFFVAVDLDDAARASAVAVIDAHSRALKAKWLRPDKLHVTLQYLGHPKPEALAALQPRLAEVASRHRRFRLRLRGAGTFGTARAPAVLWLGVEGDLDALRALQRDVAAACGEAPDKPFVPHVTLARAQHRAPVQALAASLESFESPVFQVGGMALYESLNHVYRQVAAWPIGG